MRAFASIAALALATQVNGGVGLDIPIDAPLRALVSASANYILSQIFSHYDSTRDPTFEDESLSATRQAEQANLAAEIRQDTKIEIDDALRSELAAMIPDMRDSLKLMRLADVLARPGAGVILPQYGERLRALIVCYLGGPDIARRSAAARAISLLQPTEPWLRKLLVFAAIQTEIQPLTSRASPAAEWPLGRNGVFPEELLRQASSPEIQNEVIENGFVKIPLVRALQDNRGVGARRAIAAALAEVLSRRPSTQADLVQFSSGEFAWAVDALRSDALTADMAPDGDLLVSLLDWLRGGMTDYITRGEKPGVREQLQAKLIGSASLAVKRFGKTPCDRAYGGSSFF